MDTSGELIERCARHRAEDLGAMSDEAYAELVAAVRANPQKYVERADDQAFSIICKAIDTYDKARLDDDLLEDVQYAEARMRRFAAIQEACARALEIDPSCTDARLLQVLATDDAPSPLFENLLRLLNEIKGHKSIELPASGDAWNDAFARPLLRVRAATARMALATTHARMAAGLCQLALDDAPSDDLGCRFTLALALSRLENEAGLDELDARFERRGNAWMHLARAILMFKLDRIPAARRALRGYASLCEGGAYALARPVYIERYLPDRPRFKPGSFEEAVLATHEADPIVMDTPDFVGWAITDGGISDSARDFAERRGLEW